MIFSWHTLPFQALLFLIINRNIRFSSFLIKSKYAINRNGVRRYEGDKCLRCINGDIMHILIIEPLFLYSLNSLQIVRLKNTTATNML